MINTFIVLYYLTPIRNNKLMILSQTYIALLMLCRLVFVRGIVSFNCCNIHVVYVPC